jgi:hypothetical protein
METPMSDIREQFRRRDISDLPMIITLGVIVGATAGLVLSATV